MKLAERTFRRSDYKMTSPYGWRIHPVHKEKIFHSGVDYAPIGIHEVEKRWRQYALEDGEVLGAGKDTKNGNAIFAWVSYKRLGIKVLYYHLHEVYVKKGQKVNHDTIIGLTGTTGYSTGIHLHMGVKYLSNNQYFDPESFDYRPIENNSVKLDKVEIGDKVKIVGERYATGQLVPSKIKLNKYTVSKISNGKVLLKEIVSWVWLKDVIEV